MSLREKVRLLEGEMKYSQDEDRRLRSEIWALREQINRLMEHLRLREVNQPPIKIESWNKPE